MRITTTPVHRLASLPRNQLAMTICALLSVAQLAGCGTVRNEVIALKSQASDKIAEENDKQAQPVPVVTRTKAAWLLGQAVPVVAASPAFLSTQIDYAPRQLVTLTDVVTHISSKLGISIDISEVWTGASGMLGASAGNVAPRVPSLSGTTLSASGAPAAATPSSAVGGNMGSQYFLIDYGGKLSGLLDIVASKAGVWWKPVESRKIVFYKTETKTFYIPAQPTKYKGGGLINTNSSSSGNGTTGNSSSGNSSGGISSTGGSNTSTEYDVDMWRDLDNTAKIVASGGLTATNPSVRSITVTGTPTQVRNVEDWVKDLTQNLSQQVSITLDVYTVKVKAQDAYNWNPNVVFKSLSGKFGVNLSGPQAPALTSGANPLSLTASILDTATGGLGQYGGSSFAYQALSTLGDVAQVMHQTGVALNNQPMSMQLAGVEGYLASSTPSASVAVGTIPQPPSLTPASLTTGFTATFTPQINNGKIFLSLDMTSSNNNGFGKVGTETSFIQTPNYDQNKFQQSAMLTPGASLMLTGIQQHNGKSNRNGVGTPNNYVLGGGLDDSTSKQFTAIVITAKVL